MAGSIAETLDTVSRTIAASDSVDAVRAALSVFNPTAAGESFWPGGGDELLEALLYGGWRIHRFEAPYYWVVKRDDTFLAYTEGDVDYGDNPACDRDVVPM